jgi:hypothetical protein
VRAFFLIHHQHQNQITEVLGMLAHAQHLDETYGAGPHTISVPRLRHADASDVADAPPHPVDDANFKKLVAILRIAVPVRLLMDGGGMGVVGLREQAVGPRPARPLSLSLFFFHRRTCLSLPLSHFLFLSLFFNPPKQQQKTQHHSTRA